MIRRTKIWTIAEIIDYETQKTSGNIKGFMYLLKQSRSNLISEKNASKKKVQNTESSFKNINFSLIISNYTLRYTRDAVAESFGVCKLTNWMFQPRLFRETAPFRQTKIVIKFDRFLVMA